MSEMLKSALVVADRAEAIEELCSGAAALAGTVYLAYTGKKENAVNAKTAYWFGDEGVSFVNCVNDIVALAKDLAVELVICAPSRNGRLAAAVIGASFGVSVLSDCTSLTMEGGQLTAKRMVYGGAAVKTERPGSAVAVACPAEGCFQAAECAPAAEIVDKTGSGSVKLVEKRSKEVRSKSITAAKNVVGVGRGLSSEDNLPLVQALAKAIEGELGCTRPVAEEYKWLPSELNIGISGVTIKPNLYIACGISGQIQHLVGINDSRVIAAINRDENAPIFSACDIGIVGDVTTVIPELLKKFEQS